MAAKQVAKVPKPAPGDLRRLQGLLETRNAVSRAEKLASPELLADWLAGQGLIPAGVELSPADLERVKAFREGLRDLLLSSSRLDGAVERLNHAARGVRLEARLGPDGVPRLDARVSGLDGAFARWMSILVNAHLDDTWKRLKICANPECRRTFYDDSRSYTRRWCTPQCGHIVRSRAYRRTERYQRRRAERGRGSG